VKPAKDGGATPGDLKEFFATAVQSAFWLVGIVRGAPSWAITDREAKEIGDQAHKCYQTLPAANKTWLGHRLDTIAPWAGLAVAVGGTVYSKVKEEKASRGAMVQKRVAYSNPAPASSSASNGSGPAAGSGGGGNPPVSRVSPFPVDGRPSDPQAPHAPDPLISAVFDESLDSAG
jgi:hypothetical protein